MSPLKRSSIELEAKDARPEHPDRLPAEAWRMIGLTFLISWTSWIGAALTGQTNREFPTVIFYILGGFGPSLAAIWMVRRTLSRPEQADFWRRTWQPERIPPGGWLVIVLLIPGLIVLGILSTFLAGQQGAGFSGLRPILSDPVLILPALLTGLIGGPLAEELGWRGYALDRLQARFRPLGASLILAGVWALWHVPLFFIRGTLQSQMAFGSLQFWNFMLTAVGFTVLMTWLYNRSRRSILTAILAHFTFNLTITLAFPLSNSADTAKTALFLIAGVIFGLLLETAPQAAAAGSDGLPA